MENFTKTPKTPNEVINFSLINTKQCNFNCSYCYESGKFEDKQYSREDIEKIYELLKKNNKKAISLTLIGGEPTLSKHSPYLFELIGEHGEEDGIVINSITLITNGSSFNLIKDFFPEVFLEKYKNKIDVQISYDGKVIHDKNRIIKTKDKEIGTSDIVLKTIEKCLDFGFVVHLKSTLSFKHLEYVPEVLAEFRELNLKYQRKFNDKKLRFTYAVTEDKESIEILPIHVIQAFLKEYMPGILKEEMINVKTFGVPLTKWLRDARYDFNPMECAAGVKLFSINTDLEIEFCHHASYLDVPKEENKMIYGKIDDKRTYEIIEQNANYLQELVEQELNDCKNCSAVYCSKCAIHNYNQYYKEEGINSLDVAYKELQGDSICFYFKELSKYLHAFNKKARVFK